MRAYVVRRLLLIIPTIFVVTLIVFFLIRLVPGDVIDVMTAELAMQGGIDISSARDELEHMPGLDVPVVQQYGRCSF